MNLSDEVDALWISGAREPEIAAKLQMSQWQVLRLREGKQPIVCAPLPGTEVRFSTTFGRGGSTACRRIAVTLPYSGTLSEARH